MRVLIHNSDSPENRGDRAILVGMIEVARRRWPDAKIISLSQYAERDREWFGIDFLPQSPYSTRLSDWFSLFRAARSADVVLWGGGEILKDYTNKLGLVYWLVKLTYLSWSRTPIVGAFQGIGPTRAAISKWLITRTVNRTRVFITRDEESKTKLENWGVRRPVIASFDPAVMGTPTPFDGELAERLERETGIAPDFVRGAVGLGLRRWFHYQQSGWIPARYRRGRATEAESDDYRSYRARAAELADRIVDEHDADIVFFPMHMEASEGDAAFAREVIALMRHADRTRVLEADVLSSDDYAGVMSALRFFVASRLHSAILATMAGVPAFVLYYVDKGRLFFEQLGLQRLSAPIADILEPGAVDLLQAKLRPLVADAAAIQAEEAEGVARMSGAIDRDFARACEVIAR